MEKKILLFTIFTFLFFAVSTAHVALHPTYVDLLDDPSVVRVQDASKGIKSSPESVAVEDPNILLPSQKPESEPIAAAEVLTNSLPESEERARTFNMMDLRPRSDFPRFHPINRHFLDRPSRIPIRFVHRRPCKQFVKPFMIPRSEISFLDEVIPSFGSESFRDQVPAKRMKLNRHDGFRRHHRHRHDHDDDDDVEEREQKFKPRHRHDHDDDDDVEEREHKFKPRYIFDREKLKSLNHHHKGKEEKKREQEGSFLKGIRKFLKHTFD